VLAGGRTSGNPSASANPNDRQFQSTHCAVDGGLEVGKRPQLFGGSDESLFVEVGTLGFGDRLKRDGPFDFTPLELTYVTVEGINVQLDEM
jgi:hypothetical protein